MKGTRLQKPDTGLGRAVPYLPLLWFPAVIFCQELVVRCWAFGAALDRGIGFTLLFSLALGLVCDFFCCLWGERGNRRCSVVLSALLTFWLLVQTVYFTIFKTFLTVYSLGCLLYTSCNCGLLYSIVTAPEGLGNRKMR